MSRLEEECIMAVVRNRSGMDAGEIDYTLMSYKFDGQSEPSLREIVKTLGQLNKKCLERIEQLKECDHKDYALISGDRPLTIYECRRCHYRQTSEF